MSKTDRRFYKAHRFLTSVISPKKFVCSRNIPRSQADPDLDLSLYTNEKKAVSRQESLILNSPKIGKPMHVCK